MLIVMKESKAKELGVTPLAYIISYATCGVDPKVMGTGPIPSSTKALKLAGLTADDLDLIEANEAFAAQACAVNQVMKFDISKVNVNGGAIAIGHPIGASGARILTTLLYEMQKRDSKKGLATLCIGVMIGRSDFIDENKDAVNSFLEEYKKSVEYVNKNTEEAAKLSEKYDIVKAPIAQKAIPSCNIHFVSGDEMQKVLSAYLKTLFDQDPKAVGGKLPDENFYYKEA